ncbi:hypothetical protein [Halovivax sp.]|uniref:hypothetical protein n=1 Tax=Halovivax sp. TaxID=1935978 RepID=UPI0025B89789|nr:hypothetical protein [Halovivax sp.]
MNRRNVVLLGERELSVRDDRVLPLTRLIGAIIAPILFVAFVILYGFPGRTEQLFAWTIAPELTPLIMGAGYGTGVYFFYRVVTVREWHRVGPVFPGIAVFTWFMAAATALHWANFNHGHATFVFWLVLYVVSPVVVPGIWLLNRRTDPLNRIEDALEMPRSLRQGAAVSGVLITVTAVVCFLFPEPLIERWPWAVSPLTARILLGWFALFGVTNLAVSFDSRWSAARILAHSQIIGFSLVLVGVVRTWNDIDTGNPYTWPIVGGMAVYLLVVITCYAVMERRGRAE